MRRQIGLYYGSTGARLEYQHGSFPEGLQFVEALPDP